MAATLALLDGAALVPPAAPAAPRDSAGADSAHARIVRRFPEFEVRAPVYDLRSSQVVHRVSGEAMAALPVDGLTGVIALQPGVVAQAGELHVRGGRAGETAHTLDGIALDEPLRHTPVGLPLFALAGADLVAGVPEAQHAGALAGVLDLRPRESGARRELEWRWQGDGGRQTRFDRGALRASGPLGRGLGAVAAAEGTFDDTALPRLRSRSAASFAGMKWGWRAENRMLGYLRFAPVEDPQRLSLQVFAGREVTEPYDPMWSLDGWVYVPANTKLDPVFSPVPLPGYARYRAADHMAITDARHAGAVLSTERAWEGTHARATLGWLRTRSVTGAGGDADPAGLLTRVRFLAPEDADLFHVYWGDYPMRSQSGSSTVTLRLDAERASRGGTLVKAGVGASEEEVWLRQSDWFPIGWSWVGEPVVMPLDTLRAFHAWAPGGFAYGQVRWSTGGMVLNAGLRGEVWTAGPQADGQTLPRGPVDVSFSPRLGIAYPLSSRDVFSMGYVRLHQPPPRILLYDQRTAVPNHDPLGNPGLEPATVVSYEAAVKHLFGPAWALQASVFFRNVYGQPGARTLTIPQGAQDLVYVGQDEGNAGGFELTCSADAGARGRFEADYTWMQAWGNESSSAGDPYGVMRTATGSLLEDTPLAWDQRQSLRLSGAWGWRGASASWSTAIGSALPWTPKPVHEVPSDPALENSRRLDWSESTNLDLAWAPGFARGLRLGLEVRNLFDHRGDRLATVDGYPNPFVNTVYDDYGAYRTLTGDGGGAYLAPQPGGGAAWVAVHDPRLQEPPRTVRFGIGAAW